VRELNREEQLRLRDELAELMWQWARRMLDLGPEDRPFSRFDADLERAAAAGDHAGLRRVYLATLRAGLAVQRAVDEEVDTAAWEAMAEHGASYGELGEAAGMTRQGARKRWPALAAAAARRRAREPGSAGDGREAGAR
jgi:hypothetical protein